jgi:cytochrome c553
VGSVAIIIAVSYVAATLLVTSVAIDDDADQKAAAPVALALAATQLLFVWNLVQTLRGAGVRRGVAPEAEVAAGGGGRPPRRKPRLSVASVEALVMLLVLGLVFAGGFVGWVVGHHTGHGKTTTVTVTQEGLTTVPTATATTLTTTATTTTATPGGGNAAAGKAAFDSAGCGGCHTLEAANASGTVGPNLDEKKPTAALVIDRVTNGKGGMPSFKDQLSTQQIKDVAAYVAQASGG